MELKSDMRLVRIIINGGTVFCNLIFAKVDDCTIVKTKSAFNQNEFDFGNESDFVAVVK